MRQLVKSRAGVVYREESYSVNSQLQKGTYRLSMLSSIYLTGGAIDPGHLAQPPARSGSNLGATFPDWRTFALTRLQNYGLRVVNPLEFAWADVDMADLPIDIADSSNDRVRRSLDLIDQCDGLLANLERPSYGTAMEIFYAHRRGKMVTVVGPSPFNPWVLTHSQARFSDIDLALQYIIGQQPHSAPVSWAVQNEAQLSERYEQMPPPGEPDYKFTGGRNAGAGAGSARHCLLARRRISRSGIFYRLDGRPAKPHDRLPYADQQLLHGGRSLLVSGHTLPPHSH